MAVKLGLQEIVDRRRDGGFGQRFRPAEEPCEPRNLLATRVDQILVEEEMPREAGGMFNRRPGVDLPQADRLLSRETLALLSDPAAYRAGTSVDLALSKAER